MDEPMEYYTKTCVKCGAQYLLTDREDTTRRTCKRCTPTKTEVASDVDASLD